jgi:preprotein translocase subunit YajC
MNFYNLVAMSGSPEGQGGGLAGMVPFILIIVVIYFFMIRPQSKKAKQHQQLLSSLKKGDKVVTIGGINGTVVEVREKTFLIKVSPNTDIEFLKSSVAEVPADAKEIEKKV